MVLKGGESVIQLKEIAGLLLDLGQLKEDLRIRVEFLSARR